MNIKEAIIEFEQAKNAADQGLSRQPETQIIEKLTGLLKDSHDLYSLSVEWSYVVEWLSNQPLKLSDCLNARRKYNAIFDLKDGDQSRYDRYRHLIDMRWNEESQNAIDRLKSEIEGNPNSTGSNLTLALSILMLNPNDPQYRAELENLLEDFYSRKSAQVATMTVDFAGALVGLREEEGLGIDHDIRQYVLKDQIQSCEQIMAELTLVFQAIGECREWLSQDMLAYQAKLSKDRESLRAWISKLIHFNQYCTRVQPFIEKSTRGGDFSPAAAMLNLDTPPNQQLHEFNQHPTYLWLIDLKDEKYKLRISVERQIYFYIWSAALYRLDEMFSFRQANILQGNAASARDLFSEQRKNRMKSYLTTLTQHYQQVNINPQDMPFTPELIVSGEIAQRLAAASSSRLTWLQSFQTYATPFITQPRPNPLQLIRSVLDELHTINQETHIGAGLDRDNETGLLDDLKFQNPHGGRITTSHQLIHRVVGEILQTYDAYRDWLEAFQSFSQDPISPTLNKKVINWDEKKVSILLDKEQGLFKNQIQKLQAVTGGIYCSNPKCKDQFKPVEGDRCPSCDKPGKVYENEYEQRLTIKGALAALNDPPYIIYKTSSACLEDLDLLRKQLIDEFSQRLTESRILLDEAQIAIKTFQECKDSMTAALEELERSGFPLFQKRARQEKMTLFSRKLQSVFDLCIANKDLLDIWEQHNSSFDPPVTTYYPRYRERMEFARAFVPKLDELLRRCDK